MSDERQAMRERLNAFALTGAAHKVYIEKIGWGLTADGVLAFAESEVRAALAPREQSPKLAEAEEWLRDWPSNHTSWSQRNRLCMIIAAELDRLRAEVARLSQPAPAHTTDTVDVTYYAAGESADSLYAKLTDPDDSVCMRGDPEDAADDGDEDEHVYSVRTVITRHDGSAPAQDRATRACRVYIDPCPEHRFVHGAEAEELREGIEKLLERDAFDDPGDVADDLQQLLDRVDARDSLAYAEAKRTAERAGKDGT